MTADDPAHDPARTSARNSAGGAGGRAPDPGDTRPLSLAEAEALIVAQRQEYARRHAISSAPLVAAWGMAIMLGYTVLALAGVVARADDRLAFLLFGACLAAAGCFTIVYIALRSRGVRGRSGRQGTLYGGAWIGGMVLVSIILARLNGFLATVGTPEARAVGALVSSAVPCLVVGVIYLVGAAVWEETSMGILGGWFLAVTAVATLVGLPWAWWVMAVAGGGGMLVVAVVEGLASRRAGRL